jgi:hypothetical protein
MRSRVGDHAAPVLCLVRCYRPARTIKLGICTSRASNGEWLSDLSPERRKNISEPRADEVSE